MSISVKRPRDAGRNYGGLPCAYHCTLLIFLTEKLRPRVWQEFAQGHSEVIRMRVSNSETKTPFPGLGQVGDSLGQKEGSVSG